MLFSVSTRHLAVAAAVAACPSVFWTQFVIRGFAVTSFDGISDALTGFTIS